MISTSELIHGRRSRESSDSALALTVEPSALAAMQAAVLKMLRSFENASAVSFGLEPGDAYAAIYLISSDPARLASRSVAAAVGSSPNRVHKPQLRLVTGRGQLRMRA